MDDWPDRDGTLDAASFCDLYRAAMAIDGRERRLQAATVLLLTGRLGLHPDEVVHLHEGWIDWDRCVITVPEKDPCACPSCWDVARELRSFDEPILDVIYQECWTPTPARRPRTVPFGWSRRIVAALARTFETWPVLPLAAADLPAVVEAAASHDGAPDPVAPTGLSATGARFIAGVGLSPAVVADLVGLYPGHVTPLVGEVPDAASALPALSGPDDLVAAGEGSGDRFRVAYDPTPFDGEPFDPSTVDRQTITDRSPAGPSDPDHNPRPVDPPDSVEYDPDDHADAGLPNRKTTVERPSPSASGGTAVAVGNGGPSTATESSGGPGSTDAPAAPGNVGSDATPDSDDPAVRTGADDPSAVDDAFAADDAPPSDESGNDGVPLDASASSLIDDAIAEAEEALVEEAADADGNADLGENPVDNFGDIESVASDSDGTTAGTGSSSDDEPSPGPLATGPDGGPVAPGSPDLDAIPTNDLIAEATGDVVWSGDVDPRRFVTDPVVADVTTRVAADTLRDNEPVAARVVMGQEELAIVPSDPDATGRDKLVVPFDGIIDVAIDYVPPGLDDVFDATLAVAFRVSGARSVAVVGFSEAKRHKFATALFHSLLHVTPASVTHPARVGGRVTDETPESMVMFVRPSQVEFRDDQGQSIRCTIDLTEIIHVERDERTVGNGVEPVVSIRHVSGEKPVTTEVATAELRLLKPFERYVRRKYRETLAGVRGMTLSDTEKKILVAVYSTGGDRKLSNVLELTPREITAALDALAARGLVRAEGDHATLTGKGQLAVSDRLDSVNE